MALRTMSVDIDFGVDLSEITKLDSSIDDTVKSVTGGMGKAEKSVDGLGSEFKDLGGDASKSMGKVGKEMADMGSDAVKGAKDVDKVDKSLKGLDGGEAEKAAKSVKKIGDEAKDSESKLGGLTKKLGSGLKAGLAGVGVAAGGAVAGFLAIGETSQETMEDMGKLETAFTTSGFSAEAGRKSFEGLVGILGETDQSVEAANHLAKLTDNEQDLQKWTDICTGVYATFGDSLPIEGLTEAA